jgi:hypothetical protein
MIEKDRSEVSPACVARTTVVPFFTNSPFGPNTLAKTLLSVVTSSPLKTSSQTRISLLAKRARAKDYHMVRVELLSSQLDFTYEALFLPAAECDAFTT